MEDLRGRVIGAPEISSDGWRNYRSAIHTAFGHDVAYGQIDKTYSVTNLAVKGRRTPL